MNTYSEFRPTQFDPAGLGLDNRQDWLVCPVSYTRDDAEHTLARVNYDVLAKLLDEVDYGCRDHEFHCFGHWGPGYFYLIIVRPGSECARIAQECEGALADYPLLCDSTFSEREHEAAHDDWERMGIRERIRILAGLGLNYLAARHDSPPDTIRYEFTGCGDIHWCLQ